MSPLVPILLWISSWLWAPAPAVEAAPEPEAPAAVEAARPDDAVVSVTTRVTPEPSSVGDLLEYEVTAAYPQGVTVNLPSVLRFDPFHFVSVDEAEPESTGSGLRKRFTIKLQQFAVGAAEIPAFALTYVDASGQIQTVDVPPHAIQVDALLANEVDPVRRGEDAPVSIEYPNDRAEIIAYTTAASLLLALVLFVLWRVMAARQRPVFVPPPIPPHEVALSALEELENGDLLEQGAFVDYYLQLTEIAKGYLQGRFGVDALDRTTEEIRSALVRDRARIEPLSPDEFISFLQRCDLVKFARFEPPAEEAHDATTNVRKIVEDTMLAKSAPAATPAVAEPEANSESAAEPTDEPAPTSGTDQEPQGAGPTDEPAPEPGGDTDDDSVAKDERDVTDGRATEDGDGGTS